MVSQTNATSNGGDEREMRSLTVEEVAKVRPVARWVFGGWVVGFGLA